MTEIEGEPDSRVCAMTKSDSTTRNRIRNVNSIAVQELEVKPVKTRIIGSSGYDARIVVPVFADLSDEIALTCLGALLLGALGVAFIRYQFQEIGIVLCALAALLFIGLFVQIYLLLRARTPVDAENKVDTNCDDA